MTWIYSIITILAAKGIYPAAVVLIKPEIGRKEALKTSIKYVVLGFWLDGITLMVSDWICAGGLAKRLILPDNAGLFRLKCMIAESLIQIFFAQLCVFFMKRKRMCDFGWWNGLLCLFPLMQFQVLLYLVDTEEYNNLLVGIGAVICGIVSAILLMNIVYGAWDSRSLDEIIKNQEKELQLLEKNRKQVAQREQELRELQKKCCQKLDEIYELYQNHAKKAQMQDMLTALEAELAATKEHIYCANLVANAILCEKAVQCRAAGICFEAEVKLTETIGISKLHLCSIFNNLLNNAINECGRLERETDKWIRVSCGKSGNYLCITVNNSAGKPPHRFLHSEADAQVTRAHGWGLKILEDIASVYEGYFTYKYRNGEFRAMLLLQEKTAESESEAEDVWV